MIVTCERCATQFQLDDSRIPATGVRVRCSRCKHAFQVQLPQPGGPEEPANEEEESDWQFNADLPGNQGGASPGETGPVAAQEDVDDPAGSESNPVEMFGEPGGLETGASEAPPEPESLPPVGGQRPESGPDTPPAAALGPSPIGSGASSGRQALGLSDNGELSGLERDSEDSDLGRSASDELGAADELERPEQSAEDGPDENPENWDLGGDDAEEAAVAPPPVDSASSSDTSFQVDPSALLDDRPPWHTWLARAGNASGWLMVAGLFLLGLHGGLKPVPVAAPAPIAIGEGLEVVDLSGRWVDHVEAGPIYVVSGKLHNGGARNLSAPRLAVQLLDASGESLGKLAPMLAPRRPRDLRELPLEALVLGSDVGAPQLPAGEQRDFEAVIGSLPNGTRQLRVVPAEAGPGVEGGRLTPDPAPPPAAQSARSLAPVPAAPAP